MKLFLQTLVVSQPSFCIFDVSVPCPYVSLQGHSEDCDPFISLLLLAVLASKERLLLPGLRVESHKAVTLHFYPTHLLGNIGPSSGLQEGGSTQLRSVVWHVVEHVEEHGHREVFDRRLRQIFRLAHVVTSRDSEIMLEAITIIRGFHKMMLLLLLCRRSCLWR